VAGDPSSEANHAAPWFPTECVVIADVYFAEPSQVLQKWKFLCRNDCHEPHLRTWNIAECRQEGAVCSTPPDLVFSQATARWGSG
jgi:hypothetical protein